MGDGGKLVSYKLSCPTCYRRASGKGPDWLMIDRVLGALELAEDGRGCWVYLAWLEARAANVKGEIDVVVTKVLGTALGSGNPSELAEAKLSESFGSVSYL